jgi:hypothetical protein
LRHSHISRALKVGVPAKAVADHCGTSLAMIARHYGKFLAEDRKRYAALAAPPLRLGTSSPCASCQPARSRISAACTPGPSSRAKRARNTALLAAVASGGARAKASSVPGRQAVNR